VQKLRVCGVNLSVWLLWWKRRRCEWCLFTNKSAPGHSCLSARAQWYMRDEWSGNCIFHPVPLCLCTPYTHNTTGNTCNASRRDFWQRGRGNNFRKPAPLLFFHPPASAPLSGSTLLCQPSIWWLETTHFIAVTRHDGPARPEPLDLFLALCSSEPPSERQRVGRLASLLICHGWTARKGLKPFSSGGFLISVDLVVQPELSITIFESLTVCEPIVELDIMKRVF